MYWKLKSNSFSSSTTSSRHASQTEYNPLFVYGGVGLGKTHLMHAIGNKLLEEGQCKDCYVHSERFVSDMVKALQLGASMNLKNFIEA